MADPKNPTSFPSTPQALLGGKGGSDKPKPGAPYSSQPPSPEGGWGLGDIGKAISDVGKAVVNRVDFVKNYANVVARTWADDGFLKKLVDDPIGTLGGSGIPTVPGSIVRVVECKITGMGRMEEQIDEWVKGNQTGMYNLYVPQRPEEIDAGTVGGGDIGCCCTPCCCCT